MSIRVLCADDHEIVRYGLCLLLENEPDIDIVGQAGNAAETLALLEKLHPNVLLLDLFVPGATGLSLLEDVRRQYEDVAVVMMSGHAAEGRVREALQLGAMAFVHKEEAAEELVRAIRRAVAGEKYLSPALAQRLCRVCGRPGGRAGAETAATDRTRSRDHPHGGGRDDQRRHRQAALHQPPHRRDPSLARHAEARSAQ